MKKNSETKQQNTPRFSKEEQPQNTRYETKNDIQKETNDRTAQEEIKSAAQNETSDRTSQNEIKSAEQDGTANERHTRNSRRTATRVIAYTGVMCAIVYVSTLLGFSSAQFYFNIGDTAILISAALFGPLPAMIAGGLGSFFADLTVYPATMVYTLVIKGLEGLISGLLFNLIFKRAKKTSLKIVFGILAMLLSSAFMAIGYFACQLLFYGTYATAIIALPMDIVQATISTTLASVFLFAVKLIQFREKLGIADLIKFKSIKPKQK